MKIFTRLMNAHVARGAAYVMRLVCFFVIAFGILCLIFSLMGRQSFRLHTSTGVYEDAILADQDGGSTRNMTVYGTDDIYIDANAADQIEFPTKAALYMISVLNIVPMILAYWFLSRVFTNVNKERIFTDQNAAYILYYGLLQIFSALFVPFIKLLVCELANQSAASQIMISTAMIVIRLDRVLADRKMKLNDLAARVGISNVNLSYLKTGKVRAIRFSTLDAICRELKCQPGDILEYASEDSEGRK